MISKEDEIVYKSFLYHCSPAKYDYGGHIIRSVIMSDSYLPSQVHIGFGNYMANFLFNKFGLLVRQQGMEKLTDYWHSPRTLVRMP